MLVGVREEVTTGSNPWTKPFDYSAFQPHYNRGPPGAPTDTANFETTFDVDGHVETTAGERPQKPHM